MDFLNQLLTIGGPVTLLVGVVFLLMLLVIKTIWENSKEERKSREVVDKQHVEEYKNVVKQMFEVINSNTQALTSHTEVSKELKESMRELRLTMNQK